MFSVIILSPFVPWIFRLGFLLGFQNSWKWGHACFLKIIPYWYLTLIIFWPHLPPPHSFFCLVMPFGDAFHFSNLTFWNFISYISIWFIRFFVPSFLSSLLYLSFALSFRISVLLLKLSSMLNFSYPLCWVFLCFSDFSLHSGSNSTACWDHFSRQGSFLPETFWSCHLKCSLF